MFPDLFTMEEKSCYGFKLSHKIFTFHPKKDFKS